MPWRPSTMTRTPIPAASATASDSTWPPNTLISVSRDRTTYASTCSPGRAASATPAAIDSSSPLTPCPLLALRAGPVAPHSARPHRTAAAMGRRSRGGAADGELGDAQGRLARRHGHALAVLAAHAGPRLEVVADDVDRAQRLGSVADQLRGAHRLGDLAVLDHVGLGDAEHEVAGGRVHLAAPERDAVEAVGRLPDDLVGVLGAGLDVGVGHPHHRQVLVGLAPAVAGAG